MEEKKKCKFCQSEIDKRAIICPICKKELNNVNSFVGVFIMVIIIIGFIMVVFRNSSNDNIDSIATDVSIEEFSLSKETAGYNEGNAFYVIGGIRNNLDKQYSYVQVTFNLYNKDGAQIGTAMDNINNLEPNGIWKFKAIGIVGEMVDTYKLTDITGW